MTSIEEYYNYLIAHPKRANKKILAVYSKLVQDLQNGSRTEYVNQETGETEISYYIFDKSRAERPIWFIETFCRHSKGKWAGKPVKLELWQKAMIEAAFGFINKETRKRKYKKVIWFVAKKNGKSTVAACIAWYMFIYDHEGGAEVYSVAKVKDQAKIVWDEACNMRNKSPELLKRTRKTINGLFFDQADSKFAPLASDSDTLDGKNPFFVICDEVWAWMNMDLLDIMEDGMSAREQPMLFETSTMGKVRGRVFDHEYEYCEKIIQGYEGDEHGIIDETVLPVIYELDDPTQLDDEETWFQANPNMGVSKTFAYMRGKINKTKNSPSDLANFLCKDFNVRQTATTSWLQFEDYNNGLRYDEWTDSYVVGGVDLASKNDLTCCSLLGVVDGELRLKQMYFIPSKTVDKKVREDSIPYDKWIRNGWVRTSGDYSVNLSDISDWFDEQVRDFGLRPLWIGYDRWSATYWSDDMKNRGYDLEQVIQGAKTFSPAMKEMEADLKAKRLNYNDSPVLKWCFHNLSIKSDENENIRPVKEHQKQRIDGAVSLLDCYVVLLNHYEEYMNAVGG